MALKLENPVLQPDELADDASEEARDAHNTAWEAWANQSMRFAEEVEAEAGPFPNSTWSIWEVTDFTAVAFPGKRKMTYAVNWGNKDIELDLPENPTWLDMWKAADRIIKDSGDQHHVFIEGFTEKDGGVLDLDTGS